MSRKKGGGGGGGDDWLATYGDMMTLLLCFFVLLYSMSTIDQKKWEILVRSFNPNATADSQIITGETSNEGDFDIEGSFEVPEVVESDFDELYYSLVASVEFENLSDSVELQKGDGYTFVTFKDNVFFEGDSYNLTAKGKSILDVFANALQEDSSSIGEIQVLGHTSQADPDRPNNVRNDRFLASNRATEVLVYIQEKNIIPASKLVASGYGQFRPIAGFDTLEERSKNRRVEMLITKDDTQAKSLDEYYKEIYDGQSGTAAESGTAAGTAVTPVGGTTTAVETAPSAGNSPAAAPAGN